MKEIELGIFKEFWNGFPNHLPFLGLQDSGNDSDDWNLNKSLEKLETICSAYKEPQIIESIHSLLQLDNWRPHLVAIIATLKLTTQEQQNLIPYFWKRIENGSWVSPQILSVLSIIDKEFEQKGKKILANGFEINFSPMTMVEHHSARGPESNIEAVEKVIDALRNLIENNSANNGWKENLIKLIAQNKLEINTKHNKS